ncbi:alpha/beta hydrolase [Kibdelosporangium phytohabitans]|uniref:Alpha/beta hydrolase n=1 Tax=Kibdelosporangium phytohabitans TaxID=860235 RepID=A0A0N9IDS9_9PSEU|nr:alpha/beta fold hydrolase [Kibdelosporangium phytohabitans]ALG12923.1 alpha/beta hydrolase [Kibdelosporangium phytohabitans]MBE1464630.1 pimeloyl-ACP methyl ester carboxylesterase [Kibdelosporangium phytohabitans]
MSLRVTSTAIRTFDGLNLAGTAVMPEHTSGRALVLVHGGGVTREEAGFFARLADGVAEAGVASLRFDLRGHGESDGDQKDLTLSAVLNDINAAIEHVTELSDAKAVSLLGVSFAGGICGYFAAKRPGLVDRLVLGNPLFDYKKRFVADKPYWRDDRIDEEAGKALAAAGFVAHSPSFRLGRALLNEVFWLQPRAVIAEIQAPTLIVHGTKDTFIPVESSRSAARQLKCVHKLVEIEGAQHGFAVHDDPTYADPRSQEWQAFVIRTVVDWLTCE